MEPSPFQHLFSFENGFFDSPAYGEVPATYRDALNLWLRGRRLVSDRGPASSGSSGGAFPLMVANGQVAGMSGGVGNVLYHLGIPWFAGSGNAMLDGVSIGASGGKVNLVIGGVTYSAGLTKPNTAPGFVNSATASAKFNGAYAVAYAKYRETTGAVSSRSPISVTIAVKNKKGDITLPANPGDGTTHYLLFGSRRNFGGSGVVFRVTSIDPIPVTGSPQTIAVDWQDGDLGDLAPLTNDPAPTCTHLASLGGVICAITAGGMIYPSKVGQPEAFDYGQAVRLASGEAPTAVLHGVDGTVLVATRNSVSLLVLSGSPDVPVLPRGLWAGTGFAHGNALALLHNELYGMSSTGLPVRTQGTSAPDTSFGEAILQRFLDDGFTGANTVVVADERNGCVLYCSGSRAWPFMLASNRWGGPIVLPGSTNAGIAINGLGKIAVAGTLHVLDAGGGSPSGGWFAQSPHWGANGRILTIETFRAQAANDQTLDLLKDLTATSIGGFFPLSFIAPHGNPACIKPNRKVRSVALKASGSGGGQQPAFTAEIAGTIEVGQH